MRTTLLLLLFSALSIVSNAQETKTKSHAPFVSAGVGFTPASDLSYSVEAGTWGTTSPTSFSVTFDAVKNVELKDSEFSYWVGIKPYFTVGEKEKLVYMLYFAPKVLINGNKNYLIEFGFNPNYTISNNVLLGLTIGNQSYKEAPLNPFVGAGFVFLIK